MSRILCFLLFFIFPLLPLFAEQDQVVRVRDIPPEGILLQHGWKYRVGDKPEYASPDFDDGDWEAVDPTVDIHYLPMLWKDSVVWFRIHLDIDQGMVGNLAFILEQAGASEFFLNGGSFHGFGVIGNDPKETLAVNPVEIPFSLPVSNLGPQVLAIRYRLEPGVKYTTMWGNQNFGLHLTINSFENANSYYRETRYYNEKNTAFRASAYVILAILFLAFYLSDRKKRTSLYFFLYAAIWAFVWSLFNNSAKNNLELGSYIYWASFSLVIQITGWIFFLTAIYELLGKHKRIVYFLIVLFGLTCIPVGIFVYPYGWFVFAGGFITVANFEVARVAFFGLIGKKRGATILAFGAFACLVSWILFVWVSLTFIMSIPAPPHVFMTNQWEIFSFNHLTLPVAVAIYIGYDFAKTNQTLEQKLIEVQTLSEEKNQILSSQRDLLEKEVAERTHELQESLENLKSTQAQLIQSEKMASLGQLTAGIAHEIQNPLNFVNNFSEVSVELVEEIKEERGKSQEARDETLIDANLKDVRENLEKVKLHGKRADAIVKGMLEHSRKHSGEKVETDINALAEEYLKLSYHGMRAKDKSVTCDYQTDLDPNLPKIKVIPQDIGRVFLNIINNAFQAVGTGHALSLQPLVTVSTKNLGDKIEISIKDNGPGIPYSIKDKIFQPFFTTKPTGQGTGLGLSLAYDIVKAHGGELKVKSKEGEGSEFVLTLPL